jgi:hypothetical protein
MAYGRIRPIEWRRFLTVGGIIAGLAVWLLVDSEARIDDSGLRILWQLIKGGGAALVALAGCLLVFHKRGGIVMLHGGIAVLMLSELWTGLQAKETQIAIPEGGTVQYSYDIRSAELALVDASGPDSDQVTVVPEAFLADNVGRTERIDLGKFPVSVQVHRWLPNSRLRPAAAADQSTATVGAGRTHVVDERPRATGKPGDVRNLPAAYVELFSRDGGRSLGTYLVGIELAPQPVEIDGKTYELALRDERVYWPFTVTLKDFSFDRYTGTNTAKNYSSIVQLQDPANNIDVEQKIWMNNPLRYSRMTFYQSGFDDTTEKTTILQVVTNPGWMTPYVACMLVAVGMLAHFGPMLVRFLRRRAEERVDGTGLARAPVGKYAWVFPAIVVAFFAAYVASKARMPKSRPSEPQIYEFAKFPLAYQGRIKPYDTLARNSLQYLSGRQELSVLYANKN